MIVVGVVLLVLCLLLGAGIALSNTDTTSAEAFGVSLSNVTLGALFLTGVVVGAVAMLGLGLVLVGAARKRSKAKLHQREVRSAHGEKETLAEENARLQAALEQERTASMPPAYDEDGTTAGSGAPATGDTRGRHSS